MRITNDGWTVLHVLIVSVIGWIGIILLSPLPTFSVSPAFRLMASLMPEWQWGVCFIVSSVLGYYLGRSPAKLDRCFGHGILACAHIVFATFLVLGAPATTGSGTYFLIAIAASVCLMKEAYDG